jgi:hypothetical protein
MYDLNVLRELNERAALRAIELANEDRSPSAQTEEETDEVKELAVFPLAIIARKLRSGPPLLAYIIELLESRDSMVAFREMVGEYLAEYEHVIMGEELTRRAGLFCQLFNKKFFPLDDDALSGEITIGGLVSCIPWQPLGFSYDSYHNFASFRPGYVLLLSLVECPWDEDPYGEDEEEEQDGMPGARVPILEAVGGLVGEGLVRLIPKNGWPAEKLHEMTDDTEFAGIGEFSDWVSNNTGQMHLDTLGESLGMGNSIDWSPEEVDSLTDDWRQSREILDKIHQVALLLEEDSEITFRRLMALMLENQNLIVPKEQLPLPLD